MLHFTSPPIGPGGPRGPCCPGGPCGLRKTRFYYDLNADNKPILHQ